MLAEPSGRIFLESVIDEGFTAKQAVIVAVNLRGDINFNLEPLAEFAEFMQAVKVLARDDAFNAGIDARALEH